MRNFFFSIFCLFLLVGCYESIDHEPGITVVKEQRNQWKKELELSGIRALARNKENLYIGGNFQLIDENGKGYNYLARLNTSYKPVETPLRNFLFSGDGINVLLFDYSISWNSPRIWVGGDFKAEYVNDPTIVAENLLYFLHNSSDPLHPNNRFFSIGGQNERVDYLLDFDERVFVGGHFSLNENGYTIKNGFEFDSQGLKQPISNWTDGKVTTVNEFSIAGINASNNEYYLKKRGANGWTDVEIFNPKSNFIKIKSIDNFLGGGRFPWMISIEHEDKSQEVIQIDNTFSIVPSTRITSSSSVPLKLKRGGRNFLLVAFGKDVTVEGGRHQSNVVAIIEEFDGSVFVQPLGNLQEAVYDIIIFNNRLIAATETGLYSYNFSELE
ncbi:MAG: hypothetical protein ACFB10_10170 [Salibacteraceae bacterium]